MLVASDYGDNMIISSARVISIVCLFNGFTVCVWGGGMLWKTQETAARKQEKLEFVLSLQAFQVGTQLNCRSTDQSGKGLDCETR